MSRNRVINLILIITLVAVLACYFWIYLSNWGVYFNSDTAMIGLMQKRVLENGELPIFVWKVGYMGLLLEGYLGALAQSWFGVGAFASNLPSALFLALFFIFYIFLLRKFAGIRIALLSALILAIASPWLYILGLRSWPNYAETFFLGACIWWVYLKIFNDVAEGKWQFSSFALLGFLAAFSYYTSPLSVFFILPLFAYLSISYLRISSPYLSFKGQLKRVVLPHEDIAGRNWARLIRSLTFLMWGNFLFGLIVFALNLERVEVFGTLIKWQPMAIMLSTAYYLAFLFFVKMFFGWIWTTYRYRKASLAFFMGGFLGYLPALYYRFALNKGSAKGLSSLEGTLSDLVERLGLLFRFHGELFSLPAVGWTKGFLLVAIVFLLIQFGLFLWKSTQESPKRYLYFPLLVFVPIVWVLFLVNKARGDLINGRYLIFLLPFYSVGITWGINRFSRNNILRCVAAAGVLTLGVSSYLKTKETLLEHNDLPYFEKIAEAMDRNSLTRGYANYWFAYPVNLLTKERIILEPVFSNYSPHYAKIVAGEKRIAYVDRTSNPYVHFRESMVNIYGLSYRVTQEELIYPGIKLWILEKSTPELAVSQ